MGLSEGALFIEWSNCISGDYSRLFFRKAGLDTEQ